MSFLPELSPDEYEELFRLFAAGYYQIGPPPKEIIVSQKQFRSRLQGIWDSIEPEPTEITFDDFRHSLVQRFLDRIKKEDPHFRRPKF
jgi:hypothetical protein